MDMTATLDPAPVVENDYMLLIDEDGLTAPIQLDLSQVPTSVRLHLLKTAAKSYIHNRVTTAEAKTTKANAAFASYDAAVKNDPLQTVVAKPEGEPATTDYDAVVGAAINALMTDTLGRRGTGTKKARVLRDPLITQITRAVVAKVFKDNAGNPDYKYPHAQKEVGSDGLAYLENKLPEWLAAGGTEAEFRKTIETKYINPAKTMLGINVPKSISGMADIL